MKDKNKKSAFGGALTLGIGTIAAKALGAIYRIPLTNMLGGEGLGLYQTVFPVYTLLLDFSGAAVPSAISKIIASYKGDDPERNAYVYLRSSLKLLFFLGAVGTVLMALASYPLASFQGNKSATAAYIGLAPAIFFVCVISCFRGYFQGLMSMSPTAISQVVEQTVKLAFGLALVKSALPNLSLAVAGATFAITLSEIAATAYFLIIYNRRKRKFALEFAFDERRLNSYVQTVVKTALPITLVGIMIPLSQVIDSFIIVNVLSEYRTDATSLYGILCGAVATVINLPVSACYGIATVSIPAVSRTENDAEKRKAGAKVLLLTFAVAVPCAVLCFLFAPVAVNVLFGGLTVSEKRLTTELLRASSPTVLLLSFLQTTNGVLIGGGKLYSPLTGLSIGVAVKTILNVILLKIPELNIFGGVLSVIACYFVACLINLIMIFIERKNDANQKSENREIKFSQ